MAEGRSQVVTIRPGQSIDHLLTDEDLRHFDAELEAAARGDALAALEHHMSTPVIEEAMGHHQLRELVQLGDEAPGWVYSRWAVVQAYRWMLHHQDPRVEEVVRLVLAGLHADHLDEIVDDEVAFREYGTMVAACDWVCEQVCVYELGGLRDFLDAVAQPGLVGRADQVEEWEPAGMTAYELTGVRGDVLEVRRLADDAEVDLLNLGSLSGRDVGTTVIGRVVPVSVWPFSMFESRPLAVDHATARDVVERCSDGDDLGWLWALADARDQGRLARGFSCESRTLLASDIPLERQRGATPREELPGRVVELVDAGLSEDVAQCVTVAELALVIARMSSSGLGTVAPHLNAVLVDPDVLEAVREHAADPEHEEGWTALAGVTPSPVRERCEELAELCAERRRLAS